MATTTTWKKIGKYGSPAEYYYNVSTDSPKVNGKRKLVSNPHQLVHRRCDLNWDQRFGFPFSDNAETQTIYPTPDDSSPEFARLTNEALARFTGKVRKHNASLGVTLGSIGQSRDMIVKRSQALARGFSRAESKVKKLSARERRQIEAKDRASDILEVEFGWRPLVEDIRSAFEALARSVPDGFIKSTARSTYQRQWALQGYPRGYDEFGSDTGPLWVTVGASVTITNPNVFLLNRLGLLNLPGVAWDLIPWSFVVNMVTNMGQMVNSITDFVGVTLSNGSTTSVSDLKRIATRISGVDPRQPKLSGHCDIALTQKCRRRYVGGVPTPSFMWKAPQLNMELALIAWALITQKVGNINRMIGRK